MNAIRSYVDNVFANLPRTSEVLRAKNDMLANMEEKYHEFKNQGKSENESIGAVISEFGNIDELLTELNINSPSQRINESKELRQVSREEAEGYINSKKKSGLLTAIGVFFILCGVAILIFLNASTQNADWLSLMPNSSMNPAWGVALLLIMVAIAVGLFIYSGISLEDYNYLKWDFELKGTSQKWLKEKRHEFMRYYPITLILGVMLVILAPLVIVLPIVLLDYGDMAGSLVSMMLILIAVAIFMFIYFGNIKEAYDRLLNYGEFKDEPSNKVVAAVSSAVWPLVVIIFLLNGFLGNRWGTAWIIFPITGLAFAIFNGVYKAIKGYKD